ncbi:MAG: DUF1552 domain-containing protein [Myxococcales bacterium]|nr:DUF1552 domain-containing protein [Myxococcales bacterium]
MFTRRNFLTASSLLTATAALGGAGLTSRPLRAGPGDPRRVVIFVEGNGVRPACMFDPLTRQALEDIAGQPIASNRDYKHDDPVVTPAAPLDQARSLGALLGGQGELSLVDRAATVFGLSATYLGGGHSTDHGALSAAKTSGGPAAPTIESALAQIPELRGTAPFDVVRLGVGESTAPLQYATCAFDKGKPAPMLIDPRSTFASLFGSVAGGVVGSDFQARKQLLGFAIEDADRELMTFTGSSRGRAKIETLHASLLAIDARNDQIAGMKDALLAVKPPDPGSQDPDPYAAVDPLDRLKIQVDIATGALIAGLTNIMVIGIGCGSYYWASQYPSLQAFYPGGQVIAGHDLRHSYGDPAYETLHEVTNRGVGEMARMARALAARPEPGGTMLDNTILVYMPDNGEQHHSNSEEWATLLLGGNNLGFKTDGRSVAYPRAGHANNRQTSNLFNSLLHAAGMPTDDFGHNDPATRVAPGPLAELWG